MAECPTCEKVLDTEHGVKIHHQTVHGGSLSLKTYTCDWCGREFERHQSKMKQSEKHYCSDDCEGKRRTFEWEPQEQPNWSGGKKSYTCDYCGDEVKKYPRKVQKSENTFCSYKCQGQWVSENKSGEDHWHFKDADGIHYGSLWYSRRREALERDDYECQDCGLTRYEHYDKYGYDLEVHHITPIRTFEDTEDANELENLVTLCTECHMNREHS